jgi:hypothetical protein
VQADAVLAGAGAFQAIARCTICTFSSSAAACSARVVGVDQVG